MAMTDAQPAWMLADKDESANVRAIRDVLAGAPRPDLLFEFFGGVGGMTRLALSLFPGLPLQSWDADEKCAGMLGAIDGVQAVHGNSVADCEVTEGSGVLMDFNLWTLLKARTVYADVMRRVFDARPKWVQVTDSSSGKLHLNYRSYGCADGKWDTYRDAVKAWARERGWVLTREARAHHKTVMLLFRPLARRS